MEGDEKQQYYFDTHNHLLDYPDQELPKVIEEALQKKVLFCAPNATREADYERMRKLAHLHPIHQFSLDVKHGSFQVVPSFGIHPYYLQHESQNSGWVQTLTKTILLNEFYAVGEIGIDYRQQVLEINSKQIQNDFFVKQLELSFLLSRTVTVHCVRAHSDLLKILKKYNRLFEQKQASPTTNEQQGQLQKQYQHNPIIMHSYGGSKEITKSLLKLSNLNIYFSLSLQRSQDLCTIIPIQQLLFETDAPYQHNVKLLKQLGIMHPEAAENEEKTNRVEYVRGNVVSLSGFYNMERGQFAKAIYENSLRAFRLLKGK